MRMLDFSSWNGALTTLLGLVMVSLVMVGIRLVFMQTIQRRRERENRQINERLRTLIAAYKTLGGSFTGDLLVDPSHVRDLLQARRNAGDEGVAETLDAALRPVALGETVSERRRRTRDAVEAALSDIILLGTEAQVRLAVHAATEMVEGRPVEVKALVISLRDFIRQALDLDPIPADLRVPDQGPVRPATGAGARGGAGGNRGDGAGAGGRGGGGGGGGGAGMGAGMGMGLGGGMAAGAGGLDESRPSSG